MIIRADRSEPGDRVKLTGVSFFEYDLDRSGER